MIGGQRTSKEDVREDVAAQEDVVDEAKAGGEAAAPEEERTTGFW